MRRGFLFVFLTFSLIFTVKASADSSSKSVDIVPLGVYLSWERVQMNAEYLGMPRWKYLCDQLDTIKKHNIDTLWVTNMIEGDLLRLMEECQNRNVKLIALLGSVEAKHKQRWIDGGDYYNKIVPEIVNKVGNSETLIAWVLSDEPKKEDLKNLEILREKFFEYDRKRFCLTVTIANTSPFVPEITDLPVVCADIYPFFGPGDINGPHTDVSSRGWYRNSIKKMVDAIGTKAVNPWIMSQAFVEIWGPRKYDENWNLIGLPGSYLHWEAPTEAEMRWQLWEALRLGCKGFFVYTLVPPDIPSEKKAKLPAPDVSFKEILAKEPTNMGNGALIKPDGTITKQLVEVSRVYKELKPITPLIGRWEPIATRRIASSEKAESFKCFVDPQDRQLYCVVVNEDFHKSVDIELKFLISVNKLTSIAGNSIVKLECDAKDFEDGQKIATITLLPGAGVVLKVE